VFAECAAGDSIQMVNIGFPERTGYGFEMVDMRMLGIFCGKPPSIQYLRRIESIRISDNFAQFNFNANTCDLSTAVN
jgi:hypothetical protein